MKKILNIIIFCLFTFSINAQIIPELSKSSIDFGNKANCEIVYDTVIVRNPATSEQSFKLIANEEIKGPACFRIINPKIKDLDLPPYDGTNAVIYIIEFNASIAAEGNNSGTLIINTDLVNYPRIEIPITASRWSSNYFFTSLDFGTIGVGVNSSANLILQISSHFPTKIKNITNSFPELSADLTNFNYSILSNDTVISIKYNILLSSAITFADTILIEIEEPCDTILRIPVSAISIESNINYISTVDLGTLSQCDKRDTTIAFNYTGVSQAIINSIGNISGNGNSANLFSANFGQSLPIILNPANPMANLIIQYLGDNSFEGVFSINVPINAIIDGKDYILDITVTGIIEGYDVIIDKNAFDFGQTFVNNPVQEHFIISNVGTTAVDFFDYKFINDSFNTLDFASPFTPFMLNPGYDYNFDIIFNPKLSDLQLDGYLIIYYQFKNCIDSIVISLKGQSLLKKHLNFEIQAGQYSPSELNVKIPVSINTNDGLELNDEKIIIQISFLRDLYFPVNVSSINNAKILSNQIVGDYRVIEIESNLPQIAINDSNANLLFEINGIVLLGEHTSTPIVIDSIYFEHPTLFEIGSVKNDTLFIDLCTAGGDRLLQIVNGGLTITHPYITTNNEIKFEIHTIEKGNYNLSIYDYLGNQINSLDFYGQKASINNFNIIINESANTLYFFILTSPSDVIKGKFIKIN